MRAALAAASGQIAALAGAAGDEAAEILEFQLALLDDESLLEPVFAAIAAGAAADVVWRRALADQIADYTAAPDEYLRARAADFVDLRDRVLAALNGGAPASEALPAKAIIYAEDLPPSRFLEIDWSGGGGLALAQGSPTSSRRHAGARARRSHGGATRRAA